MRAERGDGIGTRTSHLGDFIVVGRPPAQLALIHTAAIRVSLVASFVLVGMPSPKRQRTTRGKLSRPDQMSPYKFCRSRAGIFDSDHGALVAGRSEAEDPCGSRADQRHSLAETGGRERSKIRQ